MSKDELRTLLDQARQEARQQVWDGLYVTNEQLVWALKELGPTGTNAEAYIKATVEHVIAVREQAKKEQP
jgi:hypothetical protein